MLYSLGLCKNTFAQRRNRLTTHFSERIPVVKRRISVMRRLADTKCLSEPLPVGRLLRSVTEYKPSVERHFAASVVSDCMAGSSLCCNQFKQGSVFRLVVFRLCSNAISMKTKPNSDLTRLLLLLSHLY